MLRKKYKNEKYFTVILMPTSISQQYFFLETLLTLVTHMHTKGPRRHSITRMRTVGYSYNLRVKEKSERKAGATGRDRVMTWKQGDIKATNRKRLYAIMKDKIYFKIQIQSFQKTSGYLKNNKEFKNFLCHYYCYYYYKANLQFSSDIICLLHFHE